MSAATASISDVSKSNFINQEDGRDRRGPGQSWPQCKPRPKPASGTQVIIQGNGTSVGTVLSLRCPAKHQLVGGELVCVLLSNSTRWVGELHCKPLPPLGDFGFRVALLASIVSSGIILFMSVIFITCCLLDCVKEDKMEKQARDPDLCPWMEQAQQPEESRSHHGQNGRNNNNNNAQEKRISLWDTSDPAPCDDTQACRYQQFIYRPANSSGLVSLPGCDYDQPLLPPNPKYSHMDRQPPQYVRHPQSSFQSGTQYGGHQTRLSGGNRSNTEETDSSHTKKEFSIRIISV